MAKQTPRLSMTSDPRQRSPELPELLDARGKSEHSATNPKFQSFCGVASVMPLDLTASCETPSVASSGSLFDRMSINTSLVQLYQQASPTALLYPSEQSNEIDEKGNKPMHSDVEVVCKKQDQIMTRVAEKTSDGLFEIANPTTLESLSKKHPLPAAQGPDESFNQLRFGFMSTYRRLFTFIFLINLIALVICIALYCAFQDKYFNYSGAVTATGANLLMTALMRHEHCINALFRIVCLLPYGTPLSIRRHAAKVYCYGGLHSGSGVSAVFWYVFYTVLVAKDLAGTVAERVVVECTTAVTLVMLFMVIVMAHPLIRNRWHNQWEICHRYGAWTAILMVWVQTVAVTQAEAHLQGISGSYIIIRTPTFWFLCVITLCIVYPWVRIRRVRVRAEQLSGHAIRLHFNHCNVSYCVGNRLSDSPMKETHGFATIANKNGEKGYSCLISNGGDWTKRIIEKPPEYLWVRGAPTLGVMRIATLFKPIVVVATGSGIGPCLSFLAVRPEYPMRVLWSARSPKETYGNGILRTVLDADKDAIIVDTKLTGHPNLSQLSWSLVRESNAEAVIIISNPRVTRQVVYDLETRRVPAFGAVFDS